MTSHQPHAGAERLPPYGLASAAWRLSGQDPDVNGVQCGSTLAASCNIAALLLWMQWQLAATSQPCCSGCNVHLDSTQVVTPLDEAKVLSQRLGNTVLLKREDLQVCPGGGVLGQAQNTALLRSPCDAQAVFSFKLRGAYNRIAQLDAEQRARGVVCSSAGNHAQGVALAAQRMVGACQQDTVTCRISTTEWPQLRLPEA